MNWAKMSERGTLLGVFTLATCYRVLGRSACLLIGAPVVLYFFLTGTKQRLASLQFLQRAFNANSPHSKTSYIHGLKHFMSFFAMLLDKFAAWCGHLNFNNIECDNPEYIEKIMSAPIGGILLVSHLGCMELCRAVMNDDKKKRLHILMHSKNAQQFNRVMNYFNPKSSLNIIEVDDMGAETIMFLKDRIEDGDWVAIAADRTPVSGNRRVSMAPFLGFEAAFSQGPYILASLLECPVYTAIAIRNRAKYKVSIDLFAEQIVLPRGHKEEVLQKYALQYAQYLESYCIQYPYQWYNFFNFWQK